MKLVLCTAYDSVAGAFMTPFFVRSRGEAIRSFVDAINDDKHQFSKHGPDFSLYVVGEFDDNSGLISIPHEPERLITGFDARERVTIPESGVPLGFTAKRGNGSISL